MCVGLCPSEIFNSAPIFRMKYIFLNLYLRTCLLKGRERKILIKHLTGDQTFNPGVCPDQESNQNLWVHRTMLQPAELLGPGYDETFELPEKNSLIASEQDLPVMAPHPGAEKEVDS